MSVQSLDTPADAIVGFKGRTYLLEIKDGPKAKYTAPQNKFRLLWRGCYTTLRSDEEAVEWCKAIRSGKAAW